MRPKLKVIVKLFANALRKHWQLLEHMIKIVSLKFPKVVVSPFLFPPIDSSTDCSTAITEYIF
ncbi:hypothetical protein Patl1_00594 [Pistacia atlantica]|uniref:Uncharacterized protein n=1 Tax=Pistacia atlantica TaxID=434234 RepID=A0ACC1C7A3_9ROSI|nr:hypothetical protein Patl1_00594 [Pistacia atlantica]